MDDIPVGQSKKNQFLEEFPPDFDPTTVEEKVDLPLKVRVKSKIWKTRLQAYDEMKNDDIDTETLICMVGDIHIACQERALGVVLKYVEANSAMEASMTKELVRVLIEKALTQLKLKQKCSEIFVVLFENGAKNIIFEQIINALLHKNPKVVQATIGLINELLTQFGLRRMDNLKPFFSIMSKLTEAQQTTVKTDAINFYREATKWFGKSIEAFIGNLSEKVQIELKKVAELLPADHSMKPVRGAEEQLVQLNQDVYDLADAVEVFHKFSEQWCERVLHMEKWAEKKEQLEILLKACSVPKIQFNQAVYHPVQLLKKLMNDTNYNISTFCIKIVGVIANGLRKNFNQHSKMLLGTVLGKLRDKKQSVVDEALNTTQKLFHCLTLDEMFEELKSLLDDKAPGTKVNAFIIFEFALEEITKEKAAKLHCIKQLLSLCKKSVEDGNADVRHKAIALLAKISARAYNGNMAIELKGEKLLKYQSILSTYDSKKLTPPHQAQPQQQNIPKVQPPKQAIGTPQQVQIVKQQSQIVTSNPMNKQAIIDSSRKEQITQNSVIVPTIPTNTPNIHTKFQRQLEEQRNPFPVNEFSDSHFDKLKEQMKIPLIPTQLYEKLFSYNIQQNIGAAAYIKMKITQPSEISDLLFKWSYMISWMKESIPLQSEIATLLAFLVIQFRKDNYKLTNLEIMILYSYVRMVATLYCRNSMPKLAIRTLPLLMNLLGECLKSGLQCPKLLQLEENDEQSNVQASDFLGLMLEAVQDWNNININQQKCVIAQMISQLTKEESIIVSKKVQQSSELSNDSIKFRMEQLNQIQESVILQPVVVMEVEVDQLKQFGERCQQVFENNPNAVRDGNSIVDQAISLCRQVFRDRQTSTICQVLEKITLLMSNREFLKQLGYSKFQQLMEDQFLRMIEEIDKPFEQQNKQVIRYLNSILVRVLQQCDVPTMYMSLMDIIIKERAINNRHIQHSVQLVTRCLNKLMSQLNTSFTPQMLGSILERFNRYLVQFSSEQQPDTKRLDDFIAKALKATLSSFLHFNDPFKVLQIVQQVNLDENSILKQWVLEYLDNQKHLEMANIRRSRDTQIYQVVELLKIDFEKSVDQFVHLVRRQCNQNWRQLVEFLSVEQVQHIEQRLQQIAQQNKLDLEKKVGELESMSMSVKMQQFN